MKIKDSTRRYIVFVFALIVVIGLIVANVMGKSQNKQFAQDELIYNEMVAALQEGQFEAAVEKSTLLKNSQADSEMYNYVLGLATANVGDVEKSIRHFQRTLDINPHKVEDSMFMLQYAEILVSSEKIAEAQLVLERCVSLPIPETYPQYQERVAHLLEQIAQQS